jgi:putative flavoprotein involved in K+ transport
VLLAARTPPSIVRRDTLGIPSQLLGIATGRLPVALVDRIAWTIRRVAIPDLSPYGLPAPRRPYSDFLRRRILPILDVGIVDAVRKGRVRVVPAVEGFDDGAVVLAGGDTVEVDAVVAATGFRTGLEPLVGHLGVLDDGGVPLVHGTEQHDRAPGLHFVGFSVTLSGMLRTIGLQARDLGRAGGSSAVPSTADAG